MNSPVRSFRALFWSLALIGLTIDLASKYAIFAWLEDGPPGQYVIIPGVFSLMKNGLNEGALFGLGNTRGPTANYTFTAISAVAILVIIGWSLSRKTTRDGLLCAALGLVLAGAMGNLYDRLVFGGVRDFLWVRYERGPNDMPFNWPVFNFADSCLVCGAGLLLLHAFFSKQPTAEGQPADAASTAAAVSPLNAGQS